MLFVRAMFVSSVYGVLSLYGLYEEGVVCDVIYAIIFDAMFYLVHNSLWNASHMIGIPNC